MRPREWPEGWKQLIWLTRKYKDGKGLEERKMTEDEELEAKFLGQVIFSNSSDLNLFNLRATSEYKAVCADMVASNKREIEKYIARKGIMTRKDLAEQLETAIHTVNTAYTRPAYKTVKVVFARAGIKIYSMPDALKETAKVWQRNHKQGYIQGGIDYIRGQQFHFLEV